MSVHNGERWLAEAIDSVLNQSFTDFEFLIHDDGSSDDSLSMLRQYAAKDSRIIVSSGPNRGVAASVNQLIESARGELLARMDADDICLPDRFEKQIAYMAINPECLVLGGFDIVMDQDGRPIKTNSRPLDHEIIDGQNIRGIVSIHQPTVMMRRKAVCECGGYDPSFTAALDLDLWLRMAEIGRLANLPDILLKYRVHDKSVSASNRDLQRQRCRQACEAAWARRGLTDISFDYQEWRMGDTRASRQAFYQRYGWQAWHSGYRDTWRHYAWKSVKQAPLSINAWKLLIFGWLRRPMKQI